MITNKRYLQAMLVQISRNKKEQMFSGGGSGLAKTLAVQGLRFCVKIKTFLLEG